MQAADRLALGAFYTVDPSLPVSTDESGARKRPSSATEAFVRLRNKVALSARIHETRHTAASVLIASGADVRTVAGILGHSSPSTTLGMYTHIRGRSAKRSMP